MMAIKDEIATGSKLQRSEVVMGKSIDDAFPITMIEHRFGWKLTAIWPQDVEK